MSTLDIPQYVYTCAACGAEGADAVTCGHESASPIASLTYADFEDCVASLAVIGLRKGKPIPDPLAIWDRLEAVSDLSETNRGAILVALMIATNARQP